MVFRAAFRADTLKFLQYGSMAANGYLARAKTFSLKTARTEKDGADRFLLSRPQVCRRTPRGKKGKAAEPVHFRHIGFRQLKRPLTRHAGNIQDMPAMAQLCQPFHNPLFTGPLCRFDPAVSIPSRAGERDHAWRPPPVKLPARCLLPHRCSFIQAISRSVSSCPADWCEKTVLAGSRAQNSSLSCSVVPETETAFPAS